MPLPGPCMAHLLDARHHILYGVAGVALPLAGWLVGMLAGWLVGLLAGWLVGLLAG